MKKYILPAVLLFLVLGFNIYIRTFPVNFPQFKAAAKSITQQKISEDIGKGVDKEFADFDFRAKSKIFKERIDEYNKKNKGQIKKQENDEYLKLKDKYQDARGQTYLMELDCWHWARYTENVLKFGHPGDKIINGKEIDSLMLAPSGSELSYNKFLFYFSAFLYKIFNIIKPVPLYVFLFYLPLLFLAFLITVLYIFCYRYWGNLAAVLSCLFVGCAPIFLPRSCVGWFDTDILNLLFPLLIIWTYLIAHRKNSLSQTTIWLFFSAFWLGLFSFTWLGWWFIFLIIVLYEAFHLLNVFFFRLRYGEQAVYLFRRHLLCLSLFLVFSFIWIIILAGVQPVISLFWQLQRALSLTKPLAGILWPNVFSTVGELNRVDFPGIVEYLGGLMLFAAAIFCVMFLLLRCLLNQREKGAPPEELDLILIFWSACMLFASFQGVRFLMFLALPLGISLGGVINEAYIYLKNKKSRLTLIFLACITILAMQCVQCGYTRAKGIFPLINDSWYKLLVNLKEKTPENSILNSWWDFGDWFKVIAKRKVIFDGQSQNSPQAYWMARVLLTDNEEEAVNILRMLNGAGNSSFDAIESKINDPFKSVLILKKMISAGPKEAEAVGLKYLSRQLAQEEEGLIFNKPGPAYFIVDYNMQRIIPAISFLGNWDFNKVYLAYNLGKENKEKITGYLSDFIANKSGVERLYQEAGFISKDEFDGWVSTRLNFQSPLLKGEKRGDIVFFDRGLVYSPKDKTIFLYSPQEGVYKIPKSLLIFDNDAFSEIIYPNKTLDFSVLIFKNQDEYKAILLDATLAKSMYVRLYFLNGRGLKHFKPFIEEKDGENYIRVFEIIWK